MSQNKPVAIIGSKHYDNLNLSNVIDYFDRNVRCNLGIPNGKNGTKKDEIALCNFIADRYLHNKYSWDQLKQIFEEKSRGDFKEEGLKHFYDNFNPSDYTQIWLIQPIVDRYNDILSLLKCPFKFSKQPRLGYAMILEKLYQGYIPVVIGFSIFDEPRLSSYGATSKEVIYHDKNDEIKILKWLHDSKIIDASLCLLEDTVDLRYKEHEHAFSDLMKYILHDIKNNT